MAALAHSRVAAATAVTFSPSASLRRLQGGPLSLVALPQRPKVQLRSSPSSPRRISVGATSVSALHVHAFDVHATAKLNDIGAEETEVQEVLGSSSGFLEKVFLAAAIALVPLVDVESALAAGGEFGIFEGRTAALIHPIVMFGLFLFTVYAGFLGWQWRRVRTIQNEISELKKEVKAVPVAAGGDKGAPPPPPSPLEAKINFLTEERKELVKGGFRDRHFNAGSILLGLGVLEAVGGPLNTWARTGKLFPGPHLFAGAGITVLWALAAALVPAMQKGNETARNLHIGLNVINLSLFVWQIPTGIEIVLKAIEFTKWP